MMTISSLIEREREQKKGKKYYYINTIMLKNKNRGEKYKSLGILERPKFDYTPILKKKKSLTCLHILKI